MDDRERVTRARQTVRREAFRRMVELGLNQTDLADKAGVAYKTVSRFFNTESWREPAVLRALAEALDWPPDELDRRVDLELARQELYDLESTVPGVMVLRVGQDTLAGLTSDELAELRATLVAVTLQHVAAIRARTPGRGFPTLTTGALAAVGA